MAMNATFGTLTKTQHRVNEFNYFTTPEMQLLGNINNGKVFTFKKDDVEQLPEAFTFDAEKGAIA